MNTVNALLYARSFFFFLVSLPTFCLTETLQTLQCWSHVQLQGKYLVRATLAVPLWSCSHGSSATVPTENSAPKGKRQWMPSRKLLSQLLAAACRRPGWHIIVPMSIALHPAGVRLQVRPVVLRRAEP